MMLQLFIVSQICVSRFKFANVFERKILVFMFNALCTQCGGINGFQNAILLAFIIKVQVEIFLWLNNSYIFCVCAHRVCLIPYEHNEKNFPSYSMAPLSKKVNRLSCCPSPSIPVLCYLPPINKAHLSYVILHMTFSPSLVYPQVVFGVS